MGGEKVDRRLLFVKKTLSNIDSRFRFWRGGGGILVGVMKAMTSVKNNKYLESKNWNDIH